MQSIGLGEKALITGAHAVAGQIYGRILEGFTSGLEPSNKGREQQTGNEEAEEELTGDEVFQGSRSSEDGNAISSRTSLPTPSQGFHHNRELVSQAGFEAGNPTMTDDPQHTHDLTSTLNGEESRGTSSRLSSFTLG